MNTFEDPPYRVPEEAALRGRDEPYLAPIPAGADIPSQDGEFTLGEMLGFWFVCGIAFLALGLLWVMGFLCKVLTSWSWRGAGDSHAR